MWLNPLLFWTFLLSWLCYKLWGMLMRQRRPVPTTPTETVTDSGATIVSGQGTSGTAVQGGTETVSATLTPVATNASVEASSSRAQQSKQVKKLVLFWLMPIKWHQQCQYSLKPLLNQLMRDRLLICRFCQQQIFTPTWLTMTIIKISHLKALVCPKLLVLIKKASETNPNTVLVDSGDMIQGTPFGTYKALDWSCCPRCDSPYVQGFWDAWLRCWNAWKSRV